MSEAVTIALIGGAAGIITALFTGGIKVYELIKEHRGASFEEKVQTAVTPIVENAIKPIEDRLDYMQQDVTRMRLLSLIRDEPEDAENILKVGRIYFSGMHGNSEASKRFARWLKEQNIKAPDWFIEKRSKKCLL